MTAWLEWLAISFTLLGVAPLVACRVQEARREARRRLTRGWEGRP